MRQRSERVREREGEQKSGGGRRDDRGRVSGEQPLSLFFSFAEVFLLRLVVSPSSLCLRLSSEALSLHPALRPGVAPGLTEG